MASRLRTGLSTANGQSLIEWLVAAPIVLLLGLFAIQWTLLWQARHAIAYATDLAARAGSLDHGAPSAVESGLAEGLAPFWGGQGRAQDRRRVASGMAAGWLRWHRHWPPAAAFSDFAEPASNDQGEPGSGAPEIPNDNLRYRSRQPGGQSGISVQDANRIGIAVTYGVPLVVPVVAPLAVWMMEMIDGCRTPRALSLGLTELGEPGRAARPRDWACPIYRAPDEPGGSPRWRWPVRVTSIVRMHTPLRAAASADDIPIPRINGLAEAGYPPETERQRMSQPVARPSLNRDHFPRRG